MSFFKKLFGIKPTPQNFTVNVFGKDYTIDVSPEAQELRRKEYEVEYNNRWIGINEVDFVSDNGVIIYKSNRVSSSEQEQVGFYGLKWFSDNNKYCVVFLAHDDVEHNLALVDVECKEIIYKIKLQRPHRCRLTNEGIVVCEDWGVPGKPNSFIFVFDANGNQIIKKTHNTGIGDVFQLVANENTFIYSLNETGKKFTISFKLQVKT